MSITVAANGLSVIHKGSGGEANATLPDVCMTQVGPAVVPIPYGNNAKSANLANGTATITMDGGNSVAIKGSTFSQSTGDAGGDKKGMVSGTIEGEAEFISASPTVKFEGQGVCRLSDQMTMNKANTLCLGGAQNDPLTVTPQDDDTHALIVKCKYPNGSPLVNASFELLSDGAVIASGQLGSSGEASVSSLYLAQVTLQVEESDDTFIVASVRQDNPHYISQLDHDIFFGIATLSRQAFWLPQKIGSNLNAWGVLETTLHEASDFHEMLALEVKTFFAYQHPNNTIESLTTPLLASLEFLPQETADQTAQFQSSIDAIIAEVLPRAIEEGEILSTLFQLSSRETTDRMLAFMRYRGQGNPDQYLQDYSWDTLASTLSALLESLLTNIQDRLLHIQEAATRVNYTVYANEIIQQHIGTINDFLRQLPNQIQASVDRLMSKAGLLLLNNAQVYVINDYYNNHSTAGKVIDAVVNTTQSVELEPFNYQPRVVIQNVIPIYPVRYGYVNLFGGIVPAAAPPTLPNIVQECSSTSDNNGYLLRLLQDGWIYIKEEDGDGYFHVFHYKQVRNGAAVIEQFEKYLFTNKVNAQGGLTLDTSSGRRYYPFAFVGRKASNISIAYSHHEWSPNIIDKMNGDPAARTTAMQHLDLTSESDDYSVDATKENLEAFVEDYRQREKRVLGESQSSGHRGTRQMTLDWLTTTESAYLVPDGVEAMFNQNTSGGRKGRLVALLDPVGRQIELAQAHVKQVYLEKQKDALELYPSTVATYVNALQNSSDTDIQKMVQENIATEALNTFQCNQKKDKKTYQKRRTKILELYKSFAFGKETKGRVGDLDTYLKCFFDIAPSSNKYIEQEVTKLASLGGDILQGLTASKEGKTSLDTMLKQAYEKDAQAIETSNNTLYIFLESLTAVLTQPQPVITWSVAFAAAINKLFLSVGATFAELSILQARKDHADFAKIAAKRLSAYPVKAVEVIADTLVPALLKKAGIVFHPQQTVKLSTDEIAKFLSKYIDGAAEGSARQLNQLVTRAEKTLQAGQAMFDWQQSVKKFQWELSTVKFTPPKWHIKPVKFAEIRLKVATPSRYLGIALSGGGIGALSIYFNHAAITDITLQTEFAKANPLNRHVATYDNFKLTQGLMGLTADILTLTKDIILPAAKRVIPESAMTSLIPKMGRTSGLLKLVFSSRLGMATVGILNLMGMVVFAIDAVGNFQDDNIGEGLGNSALALGSGVIFIATCVEAGITASFIPGAGWLVAIGMGLIAIGAGLVYIFKKAPIEKLLYHCFWGISEKYSFWEFQNEGNVDISFRVGKAQSLLSDKNLQVAYQIEVQEFNNMLMSPSLKLEEVDASITKEFIKPHTYHYQFSLPNFQAGTSQILAEVHLYVPPLLVMIMSNTHDLSKKILNPEATQQFKAAYQAAIQKVLLQSDPTPNGTLELTFNVTYTAQASLHWLYKPSENIAVPMRLINNDGNLTNGQAISGMIDEKPK